MVESLDFLKALNPQQREAVETTEGPLLVLSGAGTGKTRVLTTRIAYLLATGCARPWEILAVTFTNKAAKEMKERLEKMIGAQASGVWLGTFHAIGVKILSKYPGLVGLKSGFIVLGTDDQERLVKQIMQERGLDIKKWTPGIVLDIISRWKDKGLLPEQITAALDTDYCGGCMADLYRIYQERLRLLNAVDFGDLLLLPLVLFKNHSDILAEYQKKFKYILVDEYQDTNVAQYLLLRLLAKGHGNICCVGDDDQSIYSWRGAEVANILKFSQDFSGAQVIRLEQNYRSTAHILGAASALIAQNEGRLGKTLKVADGRDGSGDLVLVKSYWNGSEEANKIVELVEDEQRAGRSLSQIAVLVRASFQTREFEEALIRAGIPYKIVGGFKFYEREEIRDAVAYLRLVLNPDDDLAFLRVVNKPKRGIGEGALKNIQTAAREKRLSLFQAVGWASLRPSVRKILDGFISKIKEAQKEAKELPPARLAHHVLQEMGYIDFWRQEKSPEAESRLENINELYNVLGEFETIADFIGYTSLLMDADETAAEEQLLVMTLHASKGLEFETVFLPGWEEGLFPHQKTLDESSVQGLEEERRLAYVGITRAKEKVFISYAFNRRVYRQWQSASASRFIEELPPEHIDNQARRKKPMMTDIEDFSWHIPVKKEIPIPAHKRRVGRKVYHETFGDGVVVREEGDRLEVLFADFGLKKVLAKFLEVM